MTESWNASKSGSPIIKMLRTNGQSSFEVALDSTGRPSMKLSNPASAGPTATLEVVETGTHVRFIRPTGGANYLFLNNAGVSGIFWSIRMACAVSLFLSQQRGPPRSTASNLMESR